jgi:uncharacterized protein involved in response to NO
LAPTEIFKISASRETKLSRLLTIYISTGLVFMLLPGTFLGVWNLLSISSHRTVGAVAPAWIQAHGHAQIYGWIGTFILGIGFYSIPKLRHMDPLAMSAGWITWVLWTSGVSLRWLAGVYEWHWRAALPVSAALELTAFLIFLRAVSGHRPQDSGKEHLEKWVVVVMAGTVGLLLTLVVNFASVLSLALYGKSPELPHSFDQRFLVLQTWGFLVPFVWGFSAKWMPVFLGLRPTRGRALLLAVALNSAGTLAALQDWMKIAVVLLLGGIALAVYALRMFEPGERPAKTRGVHASFPFFVRLAYAWGIVSALLAIWAAFSGNPIGMWGASRHGLTVGFLAMMVFAVGQRVLPSFTGMHLLFSSKLMFVALLLLSLGCLLRVGSEILAYGGLVSSAWSWLPVSALTEMTAVTVFALNLAITLARHPQVAPA